MEHLIEDLHSLYVSIFTSESLYKKTSKLTLSSMLQKRQVESSKLTSIMIEMETSSRLHTV